MKGNNYNLLHGKEQDDFGILFASLLLTFRSQKKEVPMHLWGEKMYFRINFTLTPPKICTGLFHLHTIKALSWKMNVLTKSYLKGIVIATNKKCILKKTQRKYISNLIIFLFLIAIIQAFKYCISITLLTWLPYTKSYTLHRKFSVLRSVLKGKKKHKKK